MNYAQAQIKGYMAQLQGNINTCRDGADVMVPLKTAEAAVAILKQAHDMLKRKAEAV